MFFMLLLELLLGLIDWSNRLAVMRSNFVKISIIQDVNARCLSLLLLLIDHLDVLVAGPGTHLLMESLHDILVDCLLQDNFFPRRNLLQEEAVRLFLLEKSVLALVKDRDDHVHLPLGMDLPDRI
jgi:hypothetical protein